MFNFRIVENGCIIGEFKTMAHARAMLAGLKVSEPGINARIKRYIGDGEWEVCR